MDYYDPFLGEWLTGSGGQAVAQAVRAAGGSLNSLLAQLYSAGGAATADPASLFQTTDFAPTGSYLGATEPQNVANICNWTLFCSDDGNIHANDIGHFLLAESFAGVVDHVSVTTATLPAGHGRSRRTPRLAGRRRRPSALSVGAGRRLEAVAAGHPAAVERDLGRQAHRGRNLPVHGPGGRLEAQDPSPPAQNVATATLSIAVT